MNETILDNEPKPNTPRDLVCAWMASELLHGIPETPDSMKSLPKLRHREPVRDYRGTPIFFHDD